MKKVLGKICNVFLAFSLAVTLVSVPHTEVHAEGKRNDTIEIDFSEKKVKQYQGEGMVTSAMLDAQGFWDELDKDNLDVVILNTLIYYNRLFKAVNPAGVPYSLDGGILEEGKGRYIIDESKNQYINFNMTGKGAYTQVSVDEDVSGVFEMTITQKGIEKQSLTPTDASMPFYAALFVYHLDSVKLVGDEQFEGYFKLRINFGEKKVEESDPDEKKDEEKKEEEKKEEEKPAEVTPAPVTEENKEETPAAENNKTEEKVLDTEFVEGGYSYKVTGKDEVTFEGAADKNVKTVNIPATVNHQNVDYKVVAVANKALSGYKKLTTVTVGENVKTIGKSAFYKSGKLKTVKIKSDSLTKIGKKAFGKNSKKLVVKVSKDKYAAYKKLFKKAKLISVTIKKSK